MELKNLKEIAQRLKEAIEKKEKLILFGDADLDGICSVIILKDTIESLGGKIFKIYFPDREKEGYGLSELALNSLLQFSPAILILLDLGITNFEEIKKAKEAGFETIIIDHHEVIEKLPPADFILDPKQPGDEYPFKNFASAGLALRLSEEILKEKLSILMRQNLLELAALATIADLMPQEKDNKLIVEEGLKYLENPIRPALQSFSFYFHFPQEISKAISILNVREKIGDLPSTFLFLTSPDLEKAKKILEILILKHQERKNLIKKVLEEVKSLVKEEERIIFYGSESLNFSIIPAVASQLCQEYQKPTFIFKKGDKESYGTVRSPPSVNTIELMKKCKNFLLNFGGHPQASGFRIKNENLEAFKNCLIENL